MEAYKCVASLCIFHKLVAIFFLFVSFRAHKESLGDSNEYLSSINT